MRALLSTSRFSTACSSPLAFRVWSRCSSSADLGLQALLALGRDLVLVAQPLRGAVDLRGELLAQRLDLAGEADDLRVLRRVDLGLLGQLGLQRVELGAQRGGVLGELRHVVLHALGGAVAGLLPQLPELLVAALQVLAQQAGLRQLGVQLTRASGSCRPGAPPAR